MAAQIADRLTSQEQEIRLLSEEIGRLVDLGTQGTIEVDPSPTLVELRAENEKLKYRVAHLQRSLKEEQRRGGQSRQRRGGQASGERDIHSTKASGFSEQECQQRNQLSTAGGCMQTSVNGRLRDAVAGKLGREQEVATQRCHHKAQAPSRTKSGQLSFLQLVHQREYCDAAHRSWKVIFPLKDDVKEPASTIIIHRLEEIREQATRIQLENVNNHILPKWLERFEESHFKSLDSTWTILFQNPSPDKSLLLLKKSQIPVEDNKGRPKGKATLPASQEACPAPAFIKDRLQLYDALKREHDALLKERMANQTKAIKIILPDGKVIDGESWRTTPYKVAAGISHGLAENTIIAKVNNELWDLDRPLEGDCTFELLTFDNEEAQAVYWHSSAHILGETMEGYYGGCLCYGPPIENGFYYDMFLEDRGVSSNEFPVLENMCKAIIKEKQPFERLEVSKELLLEMFKYNKFKCRILNEKVDTPTTTVYRCGPLIDLCRGPHVRHTGKIKALKLYKNSSTYWEGKADMETLQRIYGISFPDNKLMKQWEQFQEEAKNRDHRKIGKDQELFFFHDLSPGSCFFLPHGAHIYNTLIEFIRDEYQNRNFTEVATPNIYNSKLWEASGHWQHYSENMFSFEVEKETFALKPMNCPGHCLMFGHRPRSWRELPLRFADFGVLHRNELSGTLSGLTRVRRFQQDDAHIFCTMEQIEEEMKGCLQFLQSVYAVFGFTFQLHLSTRPENYLGEIEMWNQAEKQLENSLNDFGQPWKLNPGDGAFYGPKIDIQIKDAIGRYHQCATIQLDFQLPIRFNLTYVSNDGDDKKRPVIIHRAILGSVERMIAILCENYGGKWPFWLSPRQVMVVPVGPSSEDYAQQVCTDFFDAGFMADVDLDHSCTLNKKIRNAQLAQYNFILVVGEKERANKAVNVRTRDNKVHGEVSIAEAIEKLTKLKKSQSKNAEEEF
ncbi:PREDICTED: probable threonine--tRNA ligase 2, cytoplasmic [Nanorana parkeri]|uniref:probable threonine--tRNA ligase 2, cytoplasmic n=1 Tax=Nanorana parkeri TaxID=125878 RepID=UPI0008545E72|nr:PREDICTED: probable threonine--tRNA ligase 2, cytoplasmic [Nanorana parkeri]